MTNQHTPPQQALHEQQRTRRRWRDGLDATDPRRPILKRSTLAGSLGALLVVVIGGAFQHQAPTTVSAFVGMPPVAVQLQHSELNEYPIYDAAVDQPAETIQPPGPTTGTILDPNSDTSVVLLANTKPSLAPHPPVPPPPPPPHPAPVPFPPRFLPRVLPPPPPPIRFPYQPPPPAFWYPTPPLYTVPYLIGDDLDTAKLILAQSGLQVGYITQQGSNQPAGTVVQTNPSANTVVPPGTPVDLIIATR